MGVRIDQARRDGATGSIDPREPREWQAIRLELRLDGSALADGGDPSLPDRDDRGVRRGGILRRESSHLALLVPAADSADERIDLARADDQQARCRLPGPPALDDAERPAGHVGPGPSRAAIGSASARAAANRRSRICIGE